MVPTISRKRGFTLLEVMVSLSILAVGLLAMIRLQVLGLTSNQGARAQMEAMQLAREVAAGLERVPFGDPRLSVTARFGSALDPATAATAHDVGAGLPIPGVRSEGDLMSEGGTRIYERRWTVLPLGVGTDSAKVIAVSVVYRERAIRTPREVIVYVGRANAGLLASNIAAYN